jgi:DNA modification methylase
MNKIHHGEVWKLGDHVLGCGSATDVDFVAKAAALTGDVKMILTDPPYGVAYVEGKKDFSKLGAEKKTGGARAIVGDHMQSEKEFADFTTEWLEAVKPFLTGYNTIYIFGADSMLRATRNAMDAAGFYYSQVLVWVKNTVVVGRKDYLPMHEMITYGWYGRHKMERSKAKSVLFHAKPASSKLHPTMKPVGLLRKIIPNGTKTGEVVYDPFGGSGSTLIACEQLGRRCLMLELDPTYAETILSRWEKLTSKQAVKVG